MAIPTHYCGHPGCHEIIPYDERYCKRHRHTRNKEVYRERNTNPHEKRFQQFYRSTPWRKLSRRWLENHPVCVECLREGVIRKADVVDHVEEIRDDFSKRFDENNLQSLCDYHHIIKSKREREKRMANKKLTGGHP